MLAQVFGIFGTPIAHALSPVMHNAAFAALGLPHHYHAFEVAPDRLEEAIQAMDALGFGGVNITLPHKEKVLPFLDRIDTTARRVGAVNTIAIENGRWVGYNTDGAGWMRALLEAGVDPMGMRALLLGSGGAAASVAYTLLEHQAGPLSIFCRRTETGHPLANRLRATFPQHEIEVFPLSEFQKIVSDFPKALLIQATPLGLCPDDPLPIPIESLQPGWVVSDLVYRPYETPLLVQAKKRGVQTIPGIGMLLYQGVLAFERWTGEIAPISVMKAALSHALNCAR